MHENTPATKSISHRLFILKSPLDTNKNEYDIILTFGFVDGQPIIPNDLELSIKLYDKMYNNYDPAFNLVDCLDYHYYSSEDKEAFLFCVKNGLNMQHSSYDISYNAAFRHSIVIKWFDDKDSGLKTGLSPENILEKTSHKFLLLYELGIIEHLTKQYFNSKQNLRNSSDFAKLISVIIGDPSSAEAIRKMISSYNTGNKSDPIQKPGIKKVKQILLKYSIELRRLNDKE